MLLGNGTGFFIALSAMSAVREIIGSRTLLGYQVLPDAFEPWLIMILPAGAFLTLGLIGFSNAFTERRHRMTTKAELERYRVSALRKEYKRRHIMELFIIFISAAIVNNFVLSLFLGICPFVGVSNKLTSAYINGYGSNICNGYNFNGKLVSLQPNTCALRFTVPADTVIHSGNCFVSAVC
jgi:Na+-translocating ferredoxin:NAD+ oxidoreductase RnfE subunit